MPPASTSSTVAFVFKRKYSDRQVADITMRDRPTWKMLPKKTGMSGSDFGYSVLTGEPQGISNTFTTAKSNAAPLKGEQFLTTDKLKYGVITLDGPSMGRAGSEGALIDFTTKHTNKILTGVGGEISYDLFRGAGKRGRRASISGNIVTLENRRDVDKFKRGMKVVASANENGSGLRAGSATVLKLNRAAGKVELDDQSAITGFQNNDYLFRQGDPGSSTGPIEGMGDCTPLAAPTSGVLFRNVERTNDVEALAGFRLDEPTELPEVQIANLAVEASLLNKVFTHAAVFPTVFQSIANRVGAKVDYVAGGTATIGFQKLVLLAAGRAIEVIAEPDIVPSELRCWHNDEHEMRCIGTTSVHLIRDGNLQPAQRMTDDDGLEYRARFQGQYIQPDPAAHGVASFQA
jgi:hypothetical protein